jgi:hypothetical protein
MCIWCSFVQNDNDILHTPEHIGRAKAVILSNWHPDDAFSSATKGLHMETRVSRGWDSAACHGVMLDVFMHLNRIVKVRLW